MDLIETFIVETTDTEVGAKTTRMLIQDTIADLSLTRAIGRLKVYVDPELPLFVFVALLRLGAPSIKVKDFAKVEMGDIGKEEVKIILEQETNIGKLQNKLWAKYGKDNILQPDRKILVVKTDPFKDMDMLREMVIEEPKQEVLDRLIDAIALRIIPEGFRVRKHELTNDYVIFVASENTLKPEWIAKGKEILEFLRREDHA